MRVALVHDYLNQAGGAERVAAAFHRMFPEAPVYTTVADPAVVNSLLPGAEIRTSWLQQLPGRRQWYRAAFLLYPDAIERFDLRGYDLVVSSSSAYAKGAVTAPGTCHICYCHTPMRFAWNFEAYAARESWGSLTRRLLPPLVARVRRWDLATAWRPTAYVANSSAVAARIRRIYGRPATVIPPPVEVDRFSAAETAGDFHLVVSRLVPYKRIDLAVEAFSRMGRRLLVIGDGPARPELERLAGPTVKFLGRRSDREVADHYARCRALIFPGEEDFGIAPLEANASGRPVIAYRAGGALDTVLPGETGVFFDRPTAASLADAVAVCDRLSWDRRRLRRHAEDFREEAFRERFLALVGETMRPRRDAGRPAEAFRV